MPFAWTLITPVLLLVASNVFMTFAGYGHLKVEHRPLCDDRRGRLVRRQGPVLREGAPRGPAERSEAPTRPRPDRPARRT